MTDPGAERSFRRRGLGRGLDALLSADDRDVAGDDAVLVSVAPASVAANPEQPRRSFPEEDLDALADSIRNHGLLHPIVVQRSADGYQLLAGERRLRAAQRAGVASIPAVVRAPVESNRDALELALTENLLRSDLNPIEEAAAYARLADGFGLSHEAIGLRLGRSRSTISNSIRLLQLPESVQRSVAEGRLSAGHARALLAAEGVERQEALARRVVDEQLSVRDTERLTQAGGPVEPVRLRRQPTPDDLALQRGFEEALGMPVELQRTPSGAGRLTVRFESDEDLDSLYRLVGGHPL